MFLYPRRPGSSFQIQSGAAKWTRPFSWSWRFLPPGEGTFFLHQIAYPPFSCLPSGCFPQFQSPEHHSWLPGLLPDASQSRVPGHSEAVPRYPGPSTILVQSQLLPAAPGWLWCRPYLLAGQWPRHLYPGSHLQRRGARVREFLNKWAVLRV